MSKYDPLWKWIRENGEDSFTLSFAEIGQIAGMSLDHSFLKYKKELQEYGCQISKNSIKTERVTFEKLPV